MLRSLLAALQARIGLLLGRGLDSRSGPFFAFLRTFVPFARTGPFLLVTRDNDVREVLARREQFTVAQYGNKMEQITGPFILGMDDIQMYRHDHTALRRVMGVDDLDRVKHLVSTHADELILHALPTGRVDVVEIADQVLVRTVGEYFGTPGPDEATMLRWSKILFQEIFLNVQNDPAVHAEAMAAAAQMCEYLDESIAARKEQMARGDHGPDDVLGRLLSAQGREPPFLEDRAIRHNLLGLIVGWIPTVSKAVTLAVEELLRRPRELGAAQSAARRNDDDELALYLFEALRFRPHNVGLLRTCAVDAVLAVGQRRETTVPAGAQVFAMTQSAMFDPDTIPAPREFRLDRPWGDYLHFGYGLHTCFGEQLNRVQIPALGRALLRHGPVARAKGRAGRLSWSGPYPRSLVLRMAPSQLGSVPTTSGERSPDRADDAMREEARET